jgi:hypothetical protein
MAVAVSGQKKREGMVVDENIEELWQFSTYM